MIVVDASVIVDVILDEPASTIVRRRLFDQPHTLAAPHLIDAEVGHVLRRSVLRGDSSSELALAALDDLSSLRIERFPHTGLLERAFQLRDNATFYDALYLALAEALDATLLTRDAALARIQGVAAKVEVLT